MTMISNHTSPERVRETVFSLPDVGPEFAMIGNPAYVMLLNDCTAQYQAQNPGETRPYIRVAAEIDFVISEALRFRVPEVPLIAGKLALGPSSQPLY